MAGRPFIIRFTRHFLNEEYNIKKKSIHQIAKEQGTYPNMIRRHMLYYGMTLRTHSEAEMLAQAKGLKKNPTKGRRRRLDERQNIARGVSHQFYASLDEKEHRERIRENRMNPEKMQDALIVVPKRGSALERFIIMHLKSRGFVVEFRRVIRNKRHRVSVDILIPDHRIAIMVDGVGHLRPVRSEEDYAVTRNRDIKNNERLIERGYTVIRLGAERADTLTRQETYYNELMECIRTILTGMHTTNLYYIGDYINK